MLSDSGFLWFVGLSKAGSWWEGFRRTDSTYVIGNLCLFGAVRMGDHLA